MDNVSIRANTSCYRRRDRDEPRRVDPGRLAAVRNRSRSEQSAWSSGVQTATFHATTTDSASIELFGWSVSKFDAKLIKIDVTSTGKTDKPFAAYTLDNAVISGYSVSAPRDGQPTESISFNFTKITEKFISYGADNKTVLATVVKGYDLALGKEI